MFYWHTITISLLAFFGMSAWAEHSGTERSGSSDSLIRISPGTVTLDSSLNVLVDGQVRGTIKVDTSAKKKKEISDILNAKIRAAQSAGSTVSIYPDDMLPRILNERNWERLVFQSPVVTTSHTKIAIGPTETLVHPSNIRVEKKLSLTFQGRASYEFPSALSDEYRKCLQKLLDLAAKKGVLVRLDPALEMHTYGWRYAYPELSAVVDGKLISTLEHVRTSEPLYLINKKFCDN